MNCYICNKELKRREPNKMKRNKHHFCSKSCYVIHWANERRGEKNPRWNPNNGRICEICSKAFRGRPKKNGQPAKYCSKKCFAISRKEWFKGENNPRWKGGIADIGTKIRHSDEYIKWRNACGTRDRIKCRFCGIKKPLIVHHIKTFEKYPKLRFEVSNGITLCRGCHIKLHREHRGIHDFTNILNDYMPNINREVIKI